MCGFNNRISTAKERISEMQGESEEIVKRGKMRKIRSEYES